MLSGSEICSLALNHTDVHETGVLRSVSEARKKQASNIFITKAYVWRPSAYEMAKYWIIGLEEK